MKRTLSLIFFLLFFIVPVFAAYVPGEILVKFKPGTIILVAGAVSAKSENIKAASVVQLNQKFGAISIEKAIPFATEPKEKIKTLVTGKRVEVPDLSAIYKIKFQVQADIEKILPEYKKDPNVEYAEPNYIVRAFKVPNDPYYAPYQWNLPQISAPSAWAISTGNTLDVVAVIDTGVDYNHEDLSGKVILGHNYVASSTGHPQNPNIPFDDNGHGTHLSGIIAAITDNNKGVAGLDWDGMIYAIKVLDYDGSGSISDTISGITEAANKGIKVLNLSLGDTDYSISFENAVNYAYTSGSLVVAAAGNENTSTPTYPAAFTNALAVAATDQADKRSVWRPGVASNYGAWVDVCAPGTDIYSTWPSNSYLLKDGTSMSTPHVAGLASLLLSRKPAWTPDQLRSRIEETCDNIDSLNPGYSRLLGKGRINAARALGIPKAEITSPAAQAYIRGTIDIKGSADSLDLSQYQILIGFGASPSSYVLLFTGFNSVTSGTLYTFNTTTVGDGLQTIKLSAMSNEPYTVEASVAVTIDNTAPTALITSPVASQTVEGMVTIKGTANDSYLDYYALEYSKDGSGYLKISASANPVVNDTLGTWDTGGLSGKYYVRLTAADKAGNISQTSEEISIKDSGAGTVGITGISKSSPNPFNPLAQGQTYFSYNLTGNTDVTVYLFTLSGDLIWQKSFRAGEEGGKANLNLVPWNGRNMYGEIVENGVYIFKVSAAKKLLDSGKVIVLKS